MYLFYILKYSDCNQNSTIFLFRWVLLGVWFLYVTHSTEKQPFLYISVVKD